MNSSRREPEYRAPIATSIRIHLRSGQTVDAILPAHVTDADDLVKFLGGAPRIVTIGDSFAGHNQSIAGIEIR